jgi:hypothetical protein
MYQLRRGPVGNHQQKMSSMTYSECWEVTTATERRHSAISQAVGDVPKCAEGLVNYVYDNTLNVQVKFQKSLRNALKSWVFSLHVDRMRPSWLGLSWLSS